jgi:hypothetical protein
VGLGAVACGRAAGRPATGGGTGGTSGGSGTGGNATGGSVSSGSGGDTSGTGGDTSGPTGGATGDGGSAGSDMEGGAGGPDEGDGGPAGASGTDASGGDVSGWYEAEAIPPNTKADKSTISHGTACQTMPPKPGDMCESGGGEVNWITEGRAGWLQYNQVSAPSDGMYDVTWWYHCGNSDNFGDKHCGGQTDPPTTPAGCRPHQIVVNGVEMTGTYHFPCFAGAWIEIHAATTVLPLKAGGANTIKVYPKSRDSADMDALQIQPPGQGVGPVITANSVVGSN